MAAQQDGGGGEGRDPGAGDPHHLPPEVVEELLEDDRTRTMLSVLGERDELPARRLVRGVLAEERDRSPDSFAQDTVRDAHHTMFEETLPKLTATELVEYDSMLGRVSLSEAGRAVLDTEE